MKLGGFEMHELAFRISRPFSAFDAAQSQANQTRSTDSHILQAAAAAASEQASKAPQREAFFPNAGPSLFASLLPFQGPYAPDSSAQLSSAQLAILPRTNSTFSLSPASDSYLRYAKMRRTARRAITALIHRSIVSGCSGSCLHSHLFTAHTSTLDSSSDRLILNKDPAAKPCPARACPAKSCPAQVTCADHTSQPA